MTNLLADVRLVLRTWLKAPGFAAIAILSIALGIGANAAVFTLVDQVLLRMLPVKNPHELVQVTFTGHRYGNNWGDGSELSVPVFKEFKDNNTVFAGMFARFGAAFTHGRSRPLGARRGRAGLGSYFPILGVGAALGPDHRRRGRPDTEWPSGRGAEPRILAQPLQRRPVDSSTRRSRSTAIHTPSSASRGRASMASKSDVRPRCSSR